jgi:hypothetical protein
MNLTIGNLQHAETIATTSPDTRFPGSANLEMAAARIM